MNPVLSNADDLRGEQGGLDQSSEPAQSKDTKSLPQYSTSEHELQEARYMGTADFVSWILNHDESSFRQERAWFKIKPKLLTDYQVELMKNLDRVRTNIGLDPNATVPQLKHQEQVTDLATTIPNTTTNPSNPHPKGEGEHL